jgi:transcriptional regulator with XRE-family HTH domain
MRDAKLFQGFGRQVQRLRREKGWSQDRLAEAIGKTVNTVSNIERGIYSPRLKTIGQIAKALGVSLHELFEPDPSETASSEQRRELNKLVLLVRDHDANTIRHVRALITLALEVKRATRTRRRNR